MKTNDGKREKVEPTPFDCSGFLKGWWVFLMVNLSSRANRSSQIKMDKNPELAMLQSNTNKNRDQNMWTILMRVGGFENKTKASEFYDYWNKKSRGLCSRIAKGISLVKKYHATENIKMWATSRTKENMISFYGEHRLWLESSSSSVRSSRTHESQRRRLKSLNEKRSSKRRQRRKEDEKSCSCGKTSRASFWMQTRSYSNDNFAFYFDRTANTTSAITNERDDDDDGKTSRRTKKSSSAIRYHVKNF